MRDTSTPALPAPQSGSITEKTAAWPVDPDVKRAKELKAARKKPRKDIDSDESRPELPSQLGPRAASAPASQRPTGEPVKDPTAPSSWQELGSKSFFTIGGLMGKKQETATFTREPQRSSLTEPPPGYRTPSPSPSLRRGRREAGSHQSDGHGPDAGRQVRQLAERRAATHVC